MKNKINIISLGVFFLMLVMIFSPIRRVQATTNTNTNSATPTAFTIPTGFGGFPDPQGGVTAIIKNLLDWLLGIIGAIAVIAFVISGAQYLMASGNERIIEVAKRNMFYSILGVIVALSGAVIITAIDTALRASLF